ncbi:hypothetical protein Btru_040195 [Bulinus truncatus]|nr:hypothetical protein Btru_040195 [Bulinus truncatus]
MAFSTYNYSASFYIQLTLIILATLTLRLGVSLWGYSGHGKPPMFGDFEAQRHWMEITVNLPAEDWYKETSDNDLQYWGLDYPPLTAYHMMINGKIAEYVNPAFVKLGSSRGSEDPALKFFMRMTVLVMDLIIFLPSAIVFFMETRRKSSSEKDVINSALIFFLFSFHVHEKTILLAIIPAILVITFDPFIVVWFMLISIFSMLPLLIKDGLLLPTVATVGLFWIICTHYLKPTEHVAKEILIAVSWLFQFSMLAACCIALATVLIPPPARYPDLFTLMVAVFSCGHFCLFAVIFHFKQFDIDILDTKMSSSKYSESNSEDISSKSHYRNSLDTRKRKKGKKYSKLNITILFRYSNKI